MVETATDPRPRTRAPNGQQALDQAPGVTPAQAPPQARPATTTAHSLVKPASKAAAKLKVLIWGESGTGKSRLALTFPKPLVVDLERSTELYGPPEFEFLRCEPTPEIRPHQLVELIRRDLAAGKFPGVETLVIDPTTVFLDYLEYTLIEKKRAEGYDLQGLKGPQRAKFYHEIKEDVARRLEGLLALPLHIVWICRAKNLWGETTSGLGVTGRTFDGNELCEYFADVILRLGPDGGAEVQKWRGAPVSGVITKPSFRALQDRLLNPTPPEVRQA